MGKITNLTKDEIVSLYTKAKDREAEIIILSELTASDTDTILEVLKDAGVFNGAYATCPRCGRSFPALSEYKRRRMCPDCQAMGRQIASLKGQIKRNMTKIQELQRWNAKYRSELDVLEIKYENGM